MIFYTDTDGSVIIHEYVATVGPNPARELACVETAAVNKTFVLPRKENSNDRIYSRFEVYADGQKAEGVSQIKARSLSHNSTIRSTDFTPRMFAYVSTAYFMIGLYPLLPLVEY